MCGLCEGLDFKCAAFVRQGQRTMATSLNLLFGAKIGGKIDGIMIEDGILWFDNSSGEYAMRGVGINYCPNCGAKMNHKYCDVVNGCVMCDVELCNGKEKK